MIFQMQRVLVSFHSKLLVEFSLEELISVLKHDSCLTCLAISELTTQLGVLWVNTACTAIMESLS